MPSDKPNKPSQTKAFYARSGFVAALILFVFLNIGLALSVPIEKLPAASLPEKNTWECHRALRFIDDSKKEGAPDIVLFGSSLMMIPSTCAEADYQKRVIDVVTDPYCTLLDHLIKICNPQAISNSYKCYNFALPGAMISDHYMVSRALFNSQRKVKLAILGISLRDFIDNSVDCAAATPAYNYFQRYLPEQEVDDMVPISMPSFTQRGEFLANKIFYLFGKRLELMNLLNNETSILVQNSLDKVFPDLNNGTDKGTTLSANADKLTNVDDILSAQEVKAGSYLIPPNMQLPWNDNTKEYKRRFKTANQTSFKVQSTYLDKLIAHHNKLGTVTLLVDMPLTDANMRLMPEGSYTKYKAMLRKAAKKKNVILLELNDHTKFDLKCFRDTVHMNGLGGQRLMTYIAQCIATTRVNDDTIKEQVSLLSKLNQSQTDRVKIGSKENTNI